jgi:hypothetical protein
MLGEARYAQRLSHQHQGLSALNTRANERPKLTEKSFSRQFVRLIRYSDSHFMQPSDSRFSGVDVGSLLEDLIGCAESMFRKRFGDKNTVLPGSAKSAEGLVHEALTQFIIKEKDWRPRCADTQQAELFYFLRKAIWHDFLDLFKDGRAFKRTEALDEENDKPASHDVDLLTALITACTDDDITKVAYQAVTDEPELEEYLDCILRDCITKRSEITQRLGITPQEARRRQERLRTRLLPWKRSLDFKRASKSQAA